MEFLKSIQGTNSNEENGEKDNNKLVKKKKGKKARWGIAQKPTEKIRDARVRPDHINPNNWYCFYCTMYNQNNTSQNCIICEMDGRPRRNRHRRNIQR